MKWLILLALAYCPLGGFCQTGGDKIIGNWENEDGQARFEIYKADSAYCAKIIWLAEPLDKQGVPKTDKNNPDKKLQTRPVLGLDIFTGLKFDNGVWHGADIYSPEKGIYAKLKIELADDNSIKIIGSKGIFSATKNWKRI